MGGFIMHMRGINFVLGLGVALGLLAGCQAASPATKQASSQSSKTSAKSVHSSAKHQAQARPYQHWHTVKDVHLPILMYHSISSGNQLRVPAKEFQTEMTYLKAHGYRTLTANKAVYALKHRRIPQKKIVWITLDDSYKDNMTAAWPILKQTHQHATINFITGLPIRKTT